jgi:23S rRNA (pseudouridine1915-N3)-methyltransferase
VAGLKINIYAINKISDSSLEGKIIADYHKRIPWATTIHQLELKEKLPPNKQKASEGELLLKSVLPGSFIIALDEYGAQCNSQDFSTRLMKMTQPISFIIGGAFGLSEEVRNKANLLLSLGSMTLSHILARIVLIEQLYRAYTISQNHPYHK